MAPQKKQWFSDFFSRIADVAAIGCFAFLWKMNNDIITLQDSDKAQQIMINKMEKRNEENHDDIIHFEALLPDEKKKVFNHE